MHFSTATSAAVLLAIAPSTLAVGSATVVNNCGFPVYYASVGQSYAANMQKIQGSFSEKYSQEGVGISIKLSPNNSASGPISQFEFTWAGGKINYDISNINGYPFSAEGMSVVPSMQNDPNNPTCVPINCPAGQSVCSAAYNAPNDVRTMVCDQNSDLTLTMCPGSSSNTRNAEAAPSAVASPAPSAAPSAVASPAPSAVSSAVPMPGSDGHVHYRVHARHIPKRA